MPSDGTLVTLATAYGLKDLLLKVMGPTCDFAGQELCAFTQRRTEQFSRIMQRAAKLVRGDDGTVPARVIRDVLYDGTLRTDELSAAYFGGVLASSKSGVSHDDRGSHHLATLERLSYYQLKAHWLIYSAVASLMQKFGLQQMPKLTVNYDAWLEVMKADDSLEFDTYTLHSLQPLNREHLMHSWTLADQNTLKLTPFYPGAELFLWANGVRSAQVGLLGHIDLTDPTLPRLPEDSFSRG